MHYLYQVTNLQNGKFYIGVQSDYKKVKHYLGSGRLIRAAVGKYGRKQFRKDILAECQTEAFAYQLEAGKAAFPPERRARMREDALRRWERLHASGFKTSLETRRRLSEAARRRKPNQRITQLGY